MELLLVIQLRNILFALSTNVYRISKFLASSSSRDITEISGVSRKCKTKELSLSEETDEKPHPELLESSIDTHTW